MPALVAQDTNMRSSSPINSWRTRPSWKDSPFPSNMDDPHVNY
jgi:hypothetical protein